MNIHISLKSLYFLTFFCLTTSAVCVRKGNPSAYTKPSKQTRNIIYLQPGQNLDALIKQNNNTVLYFYGDVCEPCKFTGPNLDAIAPSYPNVQIIKINTSINEFMLHWLAYKLKGIPALIFYKNGKRIEPVTDPRDNKKYSYISGGRKVEDLHQIFRSIYTK